MGRFDYEKNSVRWGKGGVRGQRISPNKSKASLCSTCHCSPCSDSEDCRKSRGAASRVTMYKCSCRKFVTTKPRKLARHKKKTGHK